MIFEKQILSMYKNMAFIRCDDKGLAYYYSSDDFDGLCKEEFTFSSSKGHSLKGFLYYYPNPIEGRILVFDHGFGGGHRSYMKEIEMLCRRGLMVFSYDHTGCMESEGEGAGGMAQSLCDLNDAILYLKGNPRTSALDISVMGHSWGGFSTLNISALHQDISHIVVLSGFVSVERLVNSFFGGIMKFYRPAILALECEHNEPYLAFDATETLKNTNARTLLIYSDNDPLCRKKAQYDPLVCALSDKENIRFRLEEGKYHNPNYTADAAAYLGEYSRALTKFTKKKGRTEEEKRDFVASFDWARMTAQDGAVWDDIFRTLEV